MNLASRLNIYNNLPDEEILGTYWYIDIEDSTDNDDRIMLGNYGIAGGLMDNYIHSVDIPTSSIKYEKTSWGQINAEDYEIDNEFSITFTSSVKADILEFINVWLDSIFDKNTHRFRSNYRKQHKTFKVVSFRPFNKTLSLGESILQSSFANVLGMVDYTQSLYDKLTDNTTARNLDLNIVVSAVYRMEYVYPMSLEKIDFSDDDSDRKQFTLNCDCAKITQIYGDKAKSNT